MKAARILFLLMILVPSEPVLGTCAPQSPGKLIKARVIRCDRSAPYVALAAAAQGPYHERGEVIDVAALSEERYPGRVLVTRIHAEVRLQQQWDRRGLRIKAEKNWTVVNEMSRLWWTGPVESCDSLDRRTEIELWVYAPCCDTFPYLGACLAEMNHAQPVPADKQRYLPVNAE